VYLLIVVCIVVGCGIGVLLVNYVCLLCCWVWVDLLWVDCFVGGEGELVCWYEC